MARQRKCKIGEPGCHVTYTPFNSLQKSCPNPKCAIAAGKSLKAKQHRKELKEFREKTKSRSQWVQEAEHAVRRYVRMRDALDKQPCISCGRHEHEFKHDPRGGFWDAGHYLSKGAHPELRLEPENIHRQCKQCNRDKSGNVAAYRVNLIKRIGLARVEWLEGPHPAAKWAIDELKEIKAHYNKLANDMQKRLEKSI